MQHLLIEQKGPSGILKTWRIRQEQERFTFGTSKHADLRTPESTLKGIQGVFEWRDDKWVYVSLDLHQGNLDEPIEIILDQPQELRMGTSHLRVVPYEARSALFTGEEAFSQSAKNTKPFHLYLVHYGESLLETQLLPPNQNFVSRFDPSRTAIAPQNKSQWVRVKVGDFEISQRQVHLTSQQALAMVSQDQLVDSGSKKMLLATLIGAALIGLVFLISPSSRDAREVAIDSVAPEIKEARLVLPREKKKEPRPAPTPQNQVPQQIAQKAPAPGDKISAIKALSTSRISQLIGKVSATAAKSNNVVVSNGVVAGTAPSGAALSAVGKINQDGKDWKSETKTKGVTVSTIGASGAGGLGTLKGGNTGTGGAELLEDESEVTGGLDREVIANYIKSQLGQILYCYERQLSAEPNLYGKVTVKFTIGPTGGIETQRITETTLRSSAVEGCMLQRVAKWKFPTPQGGTRVMVSYPFLFKSTN